MKSTHCLPARVAAWLLAASIVFPAISGAADFDVTTTGGALVIANGSGNGETLALSQSGADLVLTAASRTFLVNGTTTTGTASVALAGLTGIVVTGGAGNDTINVAAFTTALPSLTINGGAGNDTVNFNGNLTFVANASLDADLQNDTASPGVDAMNVAANARLVTSGNGTITMKVSRNIALATGSSLETVSGGITLEANQQVTATPGSFLGVTISDRAVVASTGTGQVTVKGRSGDTGRLQLGVLLRGGARISGGTSGTTVVLGTSVSTGSNAYGILLQDNGTQVTSSGASVSVTGTGGGTGANGGGYGVYLAGAASISSGGNGAVTVVGTGGSGGDSNIGVMVVGSTIAAGGTGSIVVTGNGGASAGGLNDGVLVTGTGAKITSVNGSITINGQASSASAGTSNAGIRVVSGGQVTSTGTGLTTATITMAGTGGGGTRENHGIYLEGAIGAVSSVDGAIRLTGTAGAGGVTANSFAVTVGNPGQATDSASITVTGLGSVEVIADTLRVVSPVASISAGANTVTIRPRTAGTQIALGGDDAAGTLGLTAAELGRITTGTLVLGDSQSGAMTVSAALTRTAATNLSLYSGSSIAVDAAIDARGGTVAFNAPNVAGAFARTERLVNLSARVQVGAGDNVLIAGFAIGGTAPKPVLIRAIGPGLTGFGVQGVLANPLIRVFRDSTVVAENDNWGNATSAAALVTATARVGGFALANNSADASLLVTLPPGSYTAQVLGGTGTGVALAEVYDASANPGTDAQRLVNVSTRAVAGTGENILIGGFVVSGSASKKVLVRGIGPALAAFGVTGTLVDPRLRVYNGSTLVAENDNWSAVAAEASANGDAARVTGAFALPNGSRDSVLVLTLAPGTYTAQVGAVDNTSTGIALVEIYEIPE